MIRIAFIIGCVALATEAMVQEERHFTDCDADCDGGERYEPNLSRGRWTVRCNTMPCDLAPPEGCACAGADIVFVLDRSNSVKEPNYWRVKQFMMDFANAYDMVISEDSRSNVRFAAVTFDRFAQEEFNLDDGLTLANHDQLMEKIWGMKYEPPQAGTNTPAGLFMANDILGAQGRPDRPQIIFIITDGKATVRNTLDEAIAAAHSDHHTVYALGIGDINEAEINNLVLNKEGYGFMISNFDDLPQILEQILGAFCCKTVKKDCTEDTTECVPECGPGSLTVSGSCVLSDSDGNVISTEDYSYDEDCCNESCPSVTDYCADNPCAPGECTEDDDGYTCSMPPPAVCP